MLNTNLKSETWDNTHQEIAENLARVVQEAALQKTDFTLPRDLYQRYEEYRRDIAPAHDAAVASLAASQALFRNSFSPLSYMPYSRKAAAIAEMFERATRDFSKRKSGLGITETTVGKRPVGVEEVTYDIGSPFYKLIHLKKDISIEQPHLLIVPPLSNHFSGLLYDAFETLLPRYNLFFMNAVDAKTVPLRHGGFDADDQAACIINSLTLINERAHALAVCQPTPQLGKAVTVMAMSEDPLQPKTMTLMAGPNDTRHGKPTLVTQLAKNHPLSWFEDNVIYKVPHDFGNAGEGRRTYPGFLQLAGFMTMHLDRHVTAHFDMFKHLMEGHGEKADKLKRFYDEYLSVMDIPAEFYLQTLRDVFQQHSLPLNQATFRGDRLDTTKVKKTAIFAVEGENDDICSVGMGEAAGIFPNAPENRHHVQRKVGHLGVFHGGKAINEIYPRMNDFIACHL